MASAVPVAPGYLVGGKYRLERRIAEGGMGAVWKARHEVLDADVAVKLMSKDIRGKELALARFEREAKASARLKSQHIVRVHDYGMDDEMPFMVMELLEGEDLGARLKRDGPMSVEELAPIFAQICKGLEVAHDAGFVHRDMKPSNVFLAREGGDEVVKLVDFGVARETKTTLVEDKTSSGVVVGSPHHMSPEQAQGEPVDHRSDIWALGVLVFRALTGEKPFQGEVMTAILLAVVSKPIPKPSDVNAGLPESIDRFMEMALCRNVERRFQRVRTMSEALTAIAEGRDVTPYLTDSLLDEDGREEATMPSGERVSLPAVAPSSEARAERTPSRTVGAVTAGVIEASGLARRARVWPWVGLVLIVGVIAFVVGRSGGDDVAPSSPRPPPTNPVQPDPDDEPPVIAPVPSPVSSSSVSPSGSAAGMPSTKASAITVPSLPIPRRGPPPKPKPRPRIDPFTGLPIK